MNSKRAIPSVSLLLNHPDIQALIALHSRENTVSAIRETLSAFREKGEAPEPSAVATLVRCRLERYGRVGIKRVINATGTLVHTNLGRAVLGPKVLEAVADHLTGYCDLEYSLEDGGRGHRAVHAEEKLLHLSGAEKALIVNNNAAAVMLAVNTFALGKEVVVSRGELVEIGGSFRLPEIIERAGGKLREVGTTNKTRLSDYAKAVNAGTGLILKMHTSNYRITGFVEETGLKELAGLGKKKKIPVMHDAGSGLFADAVAWGFEGEPDPRVSLKQGADIVSMSGDKLLGGPQAGIVLGKKKTIEAMKKNPMMRALRLGKISLVALEAALIPFINEKRLQDDVPLFGALAADIKTLKKAALRLARIIKIAQPEMAVSVEPSEGSMGGGAMPGKVIPSYAVLLSHPGHSASQLAVLFRRLKVPVIGTYYKNRFALNVRSLLKGEEKEIAGMVEGIR
jgi:L-seryl-tRNA(Ser) seleniumtransferase